MDNLLTQTTGFNVSNQYKPITTQDVLTRFESKGFKVEKVAITKPKLKTKDGFQRHMVRLSHPSLELKNVNDSRPEIVIVNSYDGSSSLRIMLGIYRLVCSNGLIVGSTINERRIRHVGDVWNNIDAAIEQVSTNLPLVAQEIERMTALQLSNDQARYLGGKAAVLSVPEAATVIDVSSALRPRRDADMQSNLWTIYNRLQEAVIRGGIKYQAPKYDVFGDFDGMRNGTTRAVKAIPRQVELNQKLWDLATNYKGEVYAD